MSFLDANRLSERLTRFHRLDYFPSLFPEYFSRVIASGSSILVCGFLAMSRSPCPPLVAVDVYRCVCIVLYEVELTGRMAAWVV